jgi:DNA (cytosine-5)-methyltransferase 1
VGERVLAEKPQTEPEWNRCEFASDSFGSSLGRGVVAGMNRYSYYEFFAGGGMVRAGLDSEVWDCRFSNDFDHKKCATYENNWTSDSLLNADIRSVEAHHLPGRADLAWASFPCQDLSLAGGGAGLKGDRSGDFWPFWKLMEALIDDGRAPKIIAIENVCGTLTSHAGKDFAAISRSFVDSNYRFGAVIIDAVYFVPQSRPRLFVIGVHRDVSIPDSVLAVGPSQRWHPANLRNSFNSLPLYTRDNWLWWDLPLPPRRNVSFAEIIEENPSDVEWHTTEETRRLISLMSDVNLAKVEVAKKSKTLRVGTVYRRTRYDENRFKLQRAEVRFDEVAGCLRTPAGGSSRQIILVIKGKEIRSRLISGRETARLMGLPDDYQLPKNYNDAYHLTGDGVVVPVVRYLAEQVFKRILAINVGLL